MNAWFIISRSRRQKGGGEGGEGGGGEAEEKQDRFPNVPVPFTTGSIVPV